MRAILPGRPQSKRQALCTAYWDGLRIVAYISGNAAIVAGGPHNILQTIYIHNVECLIAITIEETSGRIALCDEDHIYLYQPIGREEGSLRWIQAQELDLNKEGVKITYLSWGSCEELLVGGSQLLLWHVADIHAPELIWRQQIAYPVALASFTYDGGLIATCGLHDRLVKIWRRLSYESDNTRFDVSYLSHPCAVTNVHWRKPWHAGQNMDSLLYTFGSDNHVRVWIYLDPHSRSCLQLVGDIDMNAAIQPRRLSVGSVSPRRFAFIVDSRDFSMATEKAVQTGASNGTDHALEHLIEIANRAPEVCVVLDGLGHMSAWGLENVSGKKKNSTITFNIVHVDGMNIQVNQTLDPEKDYTQFCVFAGGVNQSSLSLLVHSYTGDISWYDCPISRLFDTSPRGDRAKLISSWAGHDSPIEQIVRDVHGQQLLSSTHEGHSIIWKHQNDLNSAPLLLQSSFSATGQILDAVFIEHGRYLIVLQKETVALFDVHPVQASRLAITKLEPNKSPTGILHITDHSSKNKSHRIVVIYSDQTCEAWTLALISTSKSRRRSSINRQILQPLGEITIAVEDRTSALAICEHMSATSMNHTMNRENWNAQITSLSQNVLHSLKFHQDDNHETPRFEKNTVFETNIQNPAIVSASRSGKVAVVNENRNSMSIWDISTAVCERELDFENNDTIERLAWALTPRGNHILAVGFTYNIIILGQARVRRRRLHPEWIILQNIRMRDFTSHAIGDLCCLSNGDVVVGAGNQLFVIESEANFRDHPIGRTQSLGFRSRTAAVMSVVDMLNSMLPLFHSEFLYSLATLGLFENIRSILLSLDRKLKYFTDGDHLSSTLDQYAEDFLAIATGISSSQPQMNGVLVNGSVPSDQDDQILTEDIIQRLNTNLSKYDLWQLSSEEQSHLTRTIQVYSELEKQQKSLDINALRYLNALYMSKDEEVVSWSAIMFASLSTSQDALVDLVTRYNGGKLTWEAARKSGIFLWLIDQEALRTQMENVARNEYTKHEDRNPVDCSLYYLALGKKSVLQGLWRMTIGVREKENTVKLLANNFDAPKWKATALKNAYALLSKRRFEYAAAFFLLGGSLKDAVNVCMHQLKDIQLAIAISRVYEKDDGSTLTTLLEKSLLPKAVESEHGRWMASWIYTMLVDPDKAIQVIVRPVHQVVNIPIAQIDGLVGSLTHAANDPTLTALYTQLREQLSKKNRWSGVITPKEEWDFIMRCVRHYLRMGCDALALALVRGWEFIPESKTAVHSKDESEVTKPTSNERSIFDKEEQTMQKVETKKKPPPTQFQEPSANSLLDSFGF